MSGWETEVFSYDLNQDFLDELADLDGEDAIGGAVTDALEIALGDSPREDDLVLGQAAATILAIWAGAPYGFGDTLSAYSFIRELIGYGDEEIRERAAAFLETIDTEEDLEPYLDALA